MLDLLEKACTMTTNFVISRLLGTLCRTAWLCLVFSRAADAFFPLLPTSATSPASPSTSTPPVATVQDASIRIRKTIPSDIPQIAKMLASAVVRESDAPGGAWKQRMNQLFAKADIEALLRGRLQALEEGEASWRRISEMYSQFSEEDRLKVFWATNERFRGLVAKAS